MPEQCKGMLILSFSIAAIIGLSLGLIGAGGSILTVPVLVYLAGIPPALATAYSLFIVGTTSLYGGSLSLYRKETDLRTAAMFAIPGIITIYATRKFLLPLVPEVWFETSNFVLNKSNGIMLLFSLLMLIAGWAMLQPAVQTQKHGINRAAMMATGALVGIVAGFAGAGGGFLIIPALILFTGMDMKTAVPTSLLIVAANSMVGFAGDLQNNIRPDWPFLLTFTLLSTGGMLLGKNLSKKWSGRQLKTGFGWFVIVLGILIIITEITT